LAHLIFLYKSWTFATMSQNQDYLDYNREAWNAKVSSHLESDFYRLDDFKSGWNSLSEIEIPLL